MKLDKQLVKEIAKVARLELTEEEIDKIEKDMDEVLNTFSKIQEVGTKDVKMSIQPVKLGNALREDEPKECLTQKEALSQVEDKKDEYFVGPKAL